jgi:small subunit ribosomal protein S4
MGRYTGPSCRLCRREGMKLFLKGARCNMAKCAIDRGRPVPGMHGAGRRRKTSDYGLQLREKQRLRRQYGLQEKQFRSLFDRASRTGGVTGEVLLQLLETRLDNLVFRLGFCSSRKAARQFVGQNHVTVNGRKASIPSMVVKPGSTIGVKSAKGSRDYATLNLEAVADGQLPSWLTLDKENCSGHLVSIPTREEIAPIVNEQLIVELYSK